MAKIEFDDHEIDLLLFGLSYFINNAYFQSPLAQDAYIDLSDKIESGRYLE